MNYRKNGVVPAALLIVSFLGIGCSGGNSGGGSGGGGGNPSPAATLSVSSLSFTGTDGGYPTAAQSFTITNTGTAPLVIGSEQLQGADANYFSGVGGGVGSCSAMTLQPNAACTTKVVFTPVAARSYSASLTFTDNAPNSPQTVALTGVLSASAAPAAAATLGYVMEYGGAIDSYTISPAGVWTPTSPASIGIGDNAGAMVMDPLGKFVFTAGFLNGYVSSFRMTPSTGVLVSAGSAPSSDPNNRPENMTVDPTGTFLYVSNTGMGTVTEYTVDRSTGGLTMGGTVTVPLYTGVSAGDSEPSGLVTDATGKYLYVSELGYMAAYNIDPSTGAITPLAAPNAAGGACSNLRRDATGAYLYCAPGNGSGLSMYSINTATGALTADTEVGYAIPTGQGATDVGVTFNSKFAYVTNRTDGDISLYTDNAATGALTPMSPSTYPEVGTGVGEPYAIAIDPGDQLAYVVMEAAGLEIMTINADGTLTGTSVIPINSPVAVAIYP